MQKSAIQQTNAERIESSSVNVMSASWRDYVQLAKPRMVATNLITAFGGFWVASQWNIDWATLVLMLLGAALVMASGCVFNNILDRDHDMLMDRTRKRAIPTGKIKSEVALPYAIILGLLGLAVLYIWVNPWSAWLGFIGHFTYVVIYTVWLKRTSTWSTSVGGIAGAIPPAIGYCAVNGELDMGALLLFALLFFWQPPHFWALGIRKVEEYRKAGYPLLPVVKGIQRTKWQMIPYLIALYPITILLYSMNYVGLFFLIGGLILLSIWTWQCIAGFVAKDDQAWALKSFKYSLYYLTIVFLLMIADTNYLLA